MIRCGFSDYACGRTANYWMRWVGFPGARGMEEGTLGREHRVAQVRRDRPAHFMTSWLHSSGRLNLLSTSFNDAGFDTAWAGSTVERRRCGRRSSATRAAESRPRRSGRRPERWVGERFSVRDTPRARKARAVGKDDAWEFSSP
jgi:hypothetical protein